MVKFSPWQASDTKSLVSRVDILPLLALPFEASASRGTVSACEVDDSSVYIW